MSRRGQEVCQVRFSGRWAAVEVAVEVVAAAVAAVAALVALVAVALVEVVPVEVGKGLPSYAIMINYKNTYYNTKAASIAGTAFCIIYLDMSILFK